MAAKRTPATPTALPLQVHRPVDTTSAAYGPFFDVGGEWRSYAKSLFTMAQNWKLDRATVSYADPKAPAQQSRITFPEGFFNVDQRSRQGK